MIPMSVLHSLVSMLHCSRLLLECPSPHKARLYIHCTKSSSSRWGMYCPNVLLFSHEVSNVIKHFENKATLKISALEVATKSLVLNKVIFTGNYFNISIYAISLQSFLTK